DPYSLLTERAATNRKPLWAVFSELSTKITAPLLEPTPAPINVRSDLRRSADLNNRPVSHTITPLTGTNTERAIDPIAAANTNAASAGNSVNGAVSSV